MSDIKMNVKSPEELMQLMNENIKYNWVTKGKEIATKDSDMWEEYRLLSPIECLKYGVGICLDQVELQRCFLSKLGYKCKTYVIEVSRQDTTPGHVFLLYYNKGSWMWFEHAWYTKLGIHPYETLEDALTDIANMFVEEENVLKSEEPDFNFVEYSCPEYGISHDEFRNFTRQNHDNLVYQLDLQYFNPNKR